MKKTILLLTIIFVAGTLFAQQRGFKPVIVAGTGTSELYKESHALIIGMSEYTNGWPKLSGVKKDIPEVKTALESNGFHVVVKIDLTRAELDQVFIDFITTYGQDSENRLLFYFAGHGHTLNKFGETIGYIVPVDAPNPNYNEAGFIQKAMPMSRIEEYAKQAGSKHALFLFDACFSGSLFATSRAVPEIINYKTAKPVRQFITSGSADETVPDKSIFREQFVTALTTNYADANKDGYLTGTELGKFLQDNVVNYSRNAQHPQYGKIRNQYLDKGDFVFVLNNTQQNNNNNQNTDPKESTWGGEEVVYTYGDLNIYTKIAGNFYLDGTKKGYLNANTRKTLNNVTTGTHTYKFDGTETKTGNITVYENKTAYIEVKSTKPNKTAGTKFTNTKAGCTMVWAGGGTFQMGSNSSDAYDDEKPVHTVTVTNFALSQNEITNAQYCKFLNDKGNQTKGGATWLDINDDDCQIEKSGGTFYPKSGKGNYPVIEVTWYGAKAYCEWAGGRLPTEAEWQYAAKGGNVETHGSASKYSGSNNIDDVAWYSSNSGSATHEVGQKQANAFGLHDMSGNVWEWVEDKWHSDYNGAPTNGSAWTSGSSSRRVGCGGSWATPLVIVARLCVTTTRPTSVITA